MTDGTRLFWRASLPREFAIDKSAKHLQTGGNLPLFCYHSRFRLVDRNRQHHAIVEGFKRTDGQVPAGMLAITTQVCEMGLDLDADVVVTEGAPVTSLIQRMGRGCREAYPRGGRYADVLIYPAEDEKPYKPEQFAGVSAFIHRISSAQQVSQADLEAAMADAPQPAELPKSCRFLDSGARAMAGEENFRETEEFTRSTVLPEDVNEYACLRRDHDAAWIADGLVLPVPAYLAKGKDVRLPSYLSVAEGGHYTEALGYLDEPPPTESWIV